jgi:hypothetical protein
MGKVHWKFDATPPAGQLDEAVKFLNSLDWNLFFQEKDGEWIIFSGDQRIFTAETETEFHAFVLGMALGLRVLPMEVLDQIRKIIGME